MGRLPGSTKTRGVASISAAFPDCDGLVYGLAFAGARARPGRRMNTFQTFKYTETRYRVVEQANRKIVYSLYYSSCGGRDGGGFLQKFESTTISPPP